MNRFCLLLLSVSVACKDKDVGPETGETTRDTATDTATEAFCADAPAVSWNSFGQGFLIGNCNGCHSSATTNRNDAPEKVTFDTVDEAWAWASRILARATGDDPSMPPEGGVDEDDRVRLEWWLRCAEPGT